jgi:hypothetical protein
MSMLFPSAISASTTAASSFKSFSSQTWSSGTAFRLRLKGHLPAFPGSERSHSGQACFTPFSQPAQELVHHEVQSIGRFTNARSRLQGQAFCDIRLRHIRFEFNNASFRANSICVASLLGIAPFSSSWRAFAYRQKRDFGER